MTDDPPRTSGVPSAPSLHDDVTEPLPRLASDTKELPAAVDAPTEPVAVPAEPVAVPPAAPPARPQPAARPAPRPGSGSSTANR